MNKAVYSLFVLFTVFSIIAITPSAFADHSKVDINMAVGSSVPGCEEMNMCYMPYNVALDPGGEAMWHNIDTALILYHLEHQQKDLMMYLTAA